jgi:hypothetical protein
MSEPLRNWKTTAVGIAVIAIAVAFVMGRIPLNEFLGAFAVLTGGGLALAKDSGK